MQLRSQVLLSIGLKFLQTMQNAVNRTCNQLNYQNCMINYVRVFQFMNENVTRINARDDTIFKLELIAMNIRTLGFQMK